MTTGRVVSWSRACPRPCRPVPFRTAADRGPHGAPVEVPATTTGGPPAGCRRGTRPGRSRHGGAPSRASTRMHAGSRPRGAPVETPARGRVARSPSAPRPIVARVVATSRASTRMHAGSRPRGALVEGLPAADRGPRRAPVESIDQDARRQPPAWWPRRGLARGRVARLPSAPRPIVARMVRLSRASTRMHVGNRPRGELVEVLPAAVSPGCLPHRGRSWPAWCACREHRPGCTPATARVVSLSRFRPQRPGDQVADVEPGAGRRRHGGHVESIDQDAR